MTVSRCLTPVVLAVLLGACDGVDPIEPGPDTAPLTAWVDGEPFLATDITVRRASGGLTITAADAEQTLRLAIPDLGARNYLIGPGNPVSAELERGGDSWRAEEDVGGGTITVTDWIPSYIAGSLDLRLEGGSDDSTVEVTLGRFVIIGF